MQQLKKIISEYVPYDVQEEEDKLVILACMDRFPDLLTRENHICHFTASGWVVNQTHTKVLMVYHNIYRSWSWTGGHADGDADLAAVALREVAEETGVMYPRLLSDDPFSLEILTVERHEKRGRYVGPHLHFNLTYLIEADDGAALAVKPDENSAVSWVPIEESAQKSTEPEMRPIYEKLNRKLKVVFDRGTELEQRS